MKKYFEINNLEEIKSLRELLPFIVVIPTLVGGLWQILNLFFIDITLLRFFSMSQMVADGLLVIIFSLIISTIVGLPIYFGIKIIRRVKNNKRLELEIEKRGHIHLSLFILIFFVWFVWQQQLFKKYDFDYFFSNNFSLSFFLINYNIIYFVFFSSLAVGYSYFFGYLLYLHFSKEKIFVQIVAFLKYYFSKPLLAIFFIFFLLVGYFINRQFVIPSQIENFKNIDLCVKRDFGQQQYYELRYFNDKYIFVALEHNTNQFERNRIVIYQMDDILFEKSLRK